MFVQQTNLPNVQLFHNLDLMPTTKLAMNEAYERVQPVGLISLSCNWVILHYEIDQMQVKIQ